MSILQDMIEQEIAIRTARLTAILIDMTPEDTGHAKSNWIPSVGTADRSVHGSQEAVSTSSQTTGLGELKTLKLGQPIFISNNVDYLEDLNDGSSRQAPAGFVEIAIQAGTD
jgi:hypothetical protein